MKKIKGFFALIAISILLATIALAQTNETNISKIDLKDPTPGLDSKLDKNIQVPETIQIFIRIIFGINSTEAVSFSTLIILLIIWAWIFLIISEALKFTPFFKGKLIWLGSGIITIIIASTKTILIVARFWLDLGNSFKFSETWSTGAFIVSIMGLALAFLVTLFLKDWIDKKFGKMKRDIENEELEKGIKVIRESARELDED